MLRIFLLCLPAFLLTSGVSYHRSYKVIEQGEKKILVRLKKIHAGSYELETYNEFFKKISGWKLEYPVFSLQIADADNDGASDILVGVIKSTRFDPVVRKRPFMFKLVDGHIRPLWLGSRVSMPLESFHAISRAGKTLFRTIEKEKNGTYLVGEYSWRGFGLEWKRYLVRNSSLKYSKQILKNENPG